MSGVKQQAANGKKLQHGAFQPLQQDAFSTLQHAPFLKGLLKPFKGKGGMLQLTELCRSLEDDLNALAEEIKCWPRRTDIPTPFYRFGWFGNAQALAPFFFAGRRWALGRWASMSGPAY
ncbi:hypothetical protein PSYPI_20980 [Pseudomonas syringae pv. pisi str. 1704B]|uniref:Uncharacterized protein n=1 Tax=Pseudomonas syringae pv. pisi str. 1704B TaxID=629263 RepID=F3GCA4_PSESJ|nr:hypothetical protein PSYPI_20980 [Pseudomonas syringae pv. pisi str. 1704B]